MKKRNEAQCGWGARIRQSRVALSLWLIFTTGLLIQLAAPRLKIENRVFVMPPISDARGPVLRPDVLVRRERWMQFFSGVFTVGGAFALGVCYRRKLLLALKG
ncbi:MAG TPA: hypothetical protein VND65_21685 [Candidatus Binatia bacterium]|nr:hypothetical protein [Candidatus Binatia bacterium]